MANAKNQTVGRMSPRQKMINLMYIVLTAMLALNVSSDVLSGFRQVQQGLSRTNRTLTARSQMMFEQIQAFYNKYPKQGRQWLDLGMQVRNTTDSLYDYIESLKVDIVKQCDGPQGDVNHIEAEDNLDAAAQVMLPPTGKKGAQLRTRIEQYRTFILGMLDNPDAQKNVEEALSTANVKTSEGTKRWEESLFEGMPAIAAITLLSKLQNDIRFAEGVALGSMISNLDTGELRVNHFDAFVVPESKMVMRGSKYSAEIVMAAIDTTARPRVFVNGSQIKGSHYGVATGQHWQIRVLRLYRGYGA